MATIDDIRIKLAIDAGDVAKGIKSAFTQFDAELRKKRAAEVRLSIKEDTDAAGKIAKLSEAIKGAGAVPVEINLANFDAAPIAQQLTEDLKGLPGGGVKVPVILDSSLTKKEMAQTQRDIRAAVGVVTIDWQFAAEPKGGFPKPPPGFGGGPDTGGAPPTGGAPTGGGPTPTGGPTPAAPTAERTAEQRVVDARLAKAKADKKKADLAGDVEARKKAEADVKAATAERDRLAKRRRADEAAARRAKADETKHEAEARRAQAEMQAEPEPQPVATEAKGLGGSRRGQRAAARAEREVPRGAPVQGQASGRATQLPDSPRQEAFRSSDPLANFVGKGKEEKFRRSTAPRDLLAAGRELTAEGQLRADLGMPIRDEDIVAAVKQGEMPETVNPFSGALRELGLSAARKKGLINFAREYKESGAGDVETMSVEDARAQLRALTPKQREKLFTSMGLPPTADEIAGGAMDPMKDPAVIQAWQRLMLIPAARFGEAAEETGGGIVNVNAGARKGGRATGGGQLTGGAIESAQKTAAMSLPARAKALEKRALENLPNEDEPFKPVPRPPSTKEMLRATAKKKSPEEIQRLGQIRGATAQSDEERMYDLRMGLGNALREPGAVSGPSSLLSSRPKPKLTLEDMAGLTVQGDPTPMGTTPASYETAFGRAVEARYNRLRRKAGMQPLTAAERIAAQKRATFSAVQREELGLPRLTIPGMAEGGMIRRFDEGGAPEVDVKRVRHTQAWRKTSIRQRAFQPFCTYCGTMGSGKNPLQADHILDLALGGSPFDPRNITTACKSCNLAKRGRIGWAPPGRAEGGKLRLGTIRSPRTIERLARQAPLFSRWSPDIEPDTQPGAASATWFNRDKRELGISSLHVPAGDIVRGVNRQYDMSGVHGFKSRRLFLLRGGPALGIGDPDDPTSYPQGWDGEPLLDAASIKPIAKVSGRAIDAVMRQWRQSQGIEERAEGGEVDLTKWPAWRKGFGGRSRPYGPGADWPGGARLARDFVGLPLSKRWPIGQAFFGARDFYDMMLGYGVEGEHRLALEDVFRQPQPKAHAEGGELKHTGLLGRMVARGTYDSPLPPGFSVTQVGERGPELIVQGPSGEAEVVPTHKVPTWLSRLQSRDNTGSIMGRQEGGLFPRSLPMQGRVGRQSFANIAQGTVSAANIQRVFVVNWPGAFTGAGGARPIPTIEKTPPRGRVEQPRAASETRQPRAARTRVETPEGPVPGVAGIAALEPEAFRLPSQNAQVLARLEIQRQRQLGTSRVAARAEQADIAIALAESPVRAFVTAVGQVFQTLAGRGELTRRAKEAQQRVAESQRAELNLADAVRDFQKTRLNRQALEKLGSRRTEAQETQLAEFTQTFKEQAAAIRDYRREVTRTGEEADKALEPLGGVGQAVRNLAVGGASALVAGAGFTAAFTALNAVIEIGTAAVTELADRSSDYRNSTSALTEALGEQVRAQKLAGEATVAQAAAQAGLAADIGQRISPVLARRAEGVAGIAATEEQVRLRAAARVVEEQNQGLPPGFDATLTRATGGPFELGLLPGILPGSRRSQAEILRLDLEQALNRDRAATYEQNQPPPAEGDIWGQLMQGLTGQQRPGAANDFNMFGIQSGWPIADDPRLIENPVHDAMLGALKDWSSQAAKGGAIGGLVPIEGTPEDLAANPAVQKTIEVFRSLGDDGAAFADQLAKMQAAGVGVTGPQTGFEALQFLDALQKSALTPTPQELLRTLTAGRGPDQISPLDAQLRDLARRSAVQRETVLPAQQALAFAARPITPFMDPRLRPSETLPGEAFADTEGTVGQYQEAFEKYAKFALPAQERINAQIAEGRATLESWIGPDLLGDISDLGSAIQGIQLDLGQRSLNLEVSQYNNELRIANRQLKSAQDFAKAIKGNVKDTVGGLQGQNYQLSRQLQLLGFEIQQRQINLNLALASFQTPGETSEERAARRADAEAQAKLAQEQLNLQKKISGNEFSIGLKENANAITDLTAQIALLREGKAFAIDSFAAQEAIKAMEAELAILEAEAQERFEEQVKRSDVMLGIMADFEREAGVAIDKQTAFLTNDLIPAFRKAGLAAGRSATDYVVGSIMAALSFSAAGVDHSKEAPPPEQRDYDDSRNAAGALFTTSGPHRMLVGEAGPETVAVLRNPRQMMMTAGSSGPMVVNIVFNNPSVKDESDLNAIVRKVEEALNRRVALQGLR